MAAPGILHDETPRIEVFYVQECTVTRVLLFLHHLIRLIKSGIKKATLIKAWPTYAGFNFRFEIPEKCQVSQSL